MTVIDITPLETLGLSGDGDEIIAIQYVEARFGVLFDKRDASRWVTVGAVYDALKHALPPTERDRYDLWPRFAQAIAHETGVDSRRVRRETRLLEDETGHWRLVGFFAVLIGLSWAIYRAI